MLTSATSSATSFWTTICSFKSMKVRHVHEAPVNSWKKSIWFPALVVLLMWAVFRVENGLGTSFYYLGVYPRKLRGLLGILTAPFVHADDEHIWGNTLPIFILGWAIFYHYKEIAFKIVLLSTLITGFWVWVAARPNWHIGASGVIYAFAGFLFTSGVIRKNKYLMGISLGVVFLYGHLIWNVLPLKEEVSWESHLFGAFAGILLAFFYRKEGIQRKTEKWMEEENDLDDDNPYWMVDEKGRRLYTPLSERPEKKTSETTTIHYTYIPKKPDSSKKNNLD